MTAFFIWSCVLKQIDVTQTPIFLGSLEIPEYFEIDCDL
jgi:hypothetical protein